MITTSPNPRNGESRPSIKLVTFSGLPQQLEEQIDMTWEEETWSHQPCTFILDFIHVNQISCAELGVLVHLEQKMDQQRSKLILVDLSPLVFEVFTLTQLVNHFDIRSTSKHFVPNQGIAAYRAAWREIDFWKKWC